MSASTPATIIARKRAAAAARKAASRGTSRRRAIPVPRASVSARNPAENKGSPRAIFVLDGDRQNPWSDLEWQPGKLLGGLPDPRVWKARLYPADKDQFLYSLHWAGALHLTDHADPGKTGWYALVKDRDHLDKTKFEYGPCEDAERAKAVIAEWLEDKRVSQSLGDGDDELGSLTPGAFLHIVSGAPSGAASVARGV